MMQSKSTGKNKCTFYKFIANNIVFYGQMFKRARLCHTLSIITSNKYTQSELH